MIPPPATQAAPARLALAYGARAAVRRRRLLVLPAVTVATGAFLLVIVLASMPAVRRQGAIFGDGAAVATAVVGALAGAVTGAVAAPVASAAGVLDADPSAGGVLGGVVLAVVVSALAATVASAAPCVRAVRRPLLASLTH